MPETIIEVERLESIASTLDGQIKAFRGRTEGRDLSRNERKALDELEAEHRATVEAIERARGAEARAVQMDAALRSNNVIRTFSDAPDMRGSISMSTPETRTVETATREIEDFRAYLNRGELRASMSSTDANGGYAVPNPLVDRIIDLVKDVDPIFGRARLFTIGGGATSIEVPVQAADGAISYVAETAARTETNAPTFGVQTIVAREIYGNWMATQTLLDSQPYMEEWIIGEMGKTLLQAAGVKFAVGAGSGSSESLGLFANASSGYTVRLSAAADTLSSAAFPLAFYDLPAVYHPNAVWVMAPATLATVTGFDAPNTSATTSLVQYRNDGTPTIMGKPVLLADNAPAIGNGAFPVFFGDIAQAYGVAMHRDVTVLRDPYTNKPYVGFYGTIRIGGQPLDNKAGVLIKSDNA